ncbi:MAG: ATP-dependent RNA helicase RhlE, partial [Myxococcota bacterium]
MTFDELPLDAALLRAVSAEGYTEPTPIQVQAIPRVVEGRDLLGIAQTGTGKTAAFALPVLQQLIQEPPPRRNRPTRVLVLAPTRELASQIGASFAAYGRHTPLRHCVIFGGVKQGAQVRALDEGVDILVATPGRLLDLMGQGYVNLRHVAFLILDEADRMLDMGFVHDVKKIVAKVPTDRQTLLFSATMPKAIVSLSKQILRDPIRVEVTPNATTAEKVTQAVLFVEKADKRKLLSALLERPSI